jgi:hypothetical protein
MLNFSTMAPLLKEGTPVLPKSITLQVLRVPLTRIMATTTCLALVVYGTDIGSTMGYSLTNPMRAALFLTPLMEQILVGILLGDASLRRVNANGSPAIMFKQGFLHLEYILWVTMQLAPILTQWPSLRLRRDLSAFLDVTTRSLPCLDPIYNLFIVNGVKVITMDLIHWITPVSLAYWAMDDGTSTQDGGFYFGTLGFTFAEHIILQRILWLKFGLHSTIHKQGKYSRLYIPVRDTRILRELIRPYVVQSFQYKLINAK